MGSSSEQLIGGFESSIGSVRRGWSRLDVTRLQRGRGRGRRYIELDVLSGTVPTIPPVEVVSNLWKRCDWKKQRRRLPQHHRSWRCMYRQRGETSGL